MAHPFKHAESSARKFGGKAEDYLLIHNWFDESKAFIADFRHRALRHHAEGIFLCERIFGVAITNSEGKRVPVRYIGETAREGRPGTYTYSSKIGCRKSSLNAGCTVSVSPTRAAEHARRFHPQRRKPSALNSMHLEQWQLRSSLPGISKWPHLAQTNAPSASAIIGMNSLPTTQYGHRSTRSVIAAAPLAVEVETKTQRPAPQGAIRERRGSRGILGMTLSLLASND